MLQIKDVRKKYVTGELVQTALDGVSLNLRDCEFVSILGPSGSGKTTLLNVIGGLDRYDSGDLIINGISTKEYTDRDWDSYRNHTVGFIFQSYNLIPHQTVLANVELALTISGVSAKERRKRAIKALEDVGLSKQIHKKPNQMSGGQMQRVAIARALVNNPDILLADEPTGALDSDTSVQVMELLKEVSKDRLVVMVTHNPELAEQYSSRIVRLRDGQIIDDSDPYEVEESETEPPRHENMGKASMSFFTALALSFNNLRTKKARTLLTAFAGSIGIIGIALILSLSTGFQEYIDKVQEDTLSTYPLTIQSETADMTSMMTAFAASAAEASDAPEGTVKEQRMVSQMFAQIGTNDLEAFKKYTEKHMDVIKDDLNALVYSYNIAPHIYSPDTSKEILKLSPGSIFSVPGMASSIASSYMSGTFNEMLNNRELLDSQYDVLAGKWPEEYNELLLVLQEPNSMSDYLAYSLGLRDHKELDEMIEKVMAGETVELSGEPIEWDYDDLLALEFKMIDAADTYKYNEEYNLWEDMSDDEEHMKKLIKDGETLSIVGIVCPKSGVSASALSPGVSYTSKLTDRIIEKAAKSKIVKMQLEESETDVFTGRSFAEEESASDAGLNFEDMISVDEDMLASAFGGNVNQGQITNMMQGHMNNISSSITTDTSKAQADFVSTFSKLGNGMLTSYVEAHKDPATGKALLGMEDITPMVSSYMAGGEAAAIMATLTKTYVIPADKLSMVYTPLLTAMAADCVKNNMAMPSASGEPMPIGAQIGSAEAAAEVASFASNPLVLGTASEMAPIMTEAKMQVDVMTGVGQMTGELMGSMTQAFNVDPDKIAQAFKFNLDEDELMRLMSTYTSSSTERSLEGNLSILGYADKNKPTMISAYLIDFESKEHFIKFIDDYNDAMEKNGDDDLVISYNDLTGVLMSSVRTIVDSVSYVLIAFVAVSLVVSSIMIGIITYISVLERTKEIGVLRAIGASKRNISDVFNAETFIIGLCSGLIGVGLALAAIPGINAIIHSLIDSQDVSAVLPVSGAIILILLSMGLTILGGLIPASKAAKQDPVIALRSE